MAFPIESRHSAETSVYSWTKPERFSTGTAVGPSPQQTLTETLGHIPSTRERCDQTLGVGSGRPVHRGCRPGTEITHPRGSVEHRQEGRIGAARCPRGRWETTPAAQRKDGGQSLPSNSREHGAQGATLDRRKMTRF